MEIRETAGVDRHLNWTDETGLWQQPDLGSSSSSMVSCQWPSTSDFSLRFSISKTVVTIFTNALSGESRYSQY
jgi:hypothetical protein